MSDVFISYARRSNEAHAVRVSEALRALGYSVWRDNEIPAHRAYADVLEERLKAAKAVVVLWSAEAARSQWVRSEADGARLDSKLIQLTVDGAKLPMPFDQIECANLIGWSGEAGAPAWRKVVGSVAELVGRPSEPGAPAHDAHGAAVQHARQPSPRKPIPRFLVAGVAAAALIALAAGGAWLLRSGGLLAPHATSNAVKVAVLPFEARSPGREVRDFADSLQDEIVGALSEGQIEPVSRSASAALRGPAAKKAIERIGARLVLDGSARVEGNTMRVRAHLDDPRTQATLWSRDFEAPVADATLLQSRVAHRLFVVLGCSREALQPQGGLRDTSLVSRYLHACDLFADWDAHVGYDPKAQAEWIEIHRTLTRQAPDFAPSHFTVAIATALAANSASPANAAAMRREAAAQLSQGAALAPKSPLRFAAGSLLTAVDQWGEREKLLRQAVEVAPSDALSNYWLGVMLAGAGRVQEAKEFTQRSVAGDFVYDWGIFNAAIVCLSPPFDQALSDIAKSRRQTPESLFAQETQVYCLAGAGKWDEARQVLAALPGRDFPPTLSGASDAFLVAAKSGAAADRETARRLALKKGEEGPVALLYAMTWLSALGYLDDAFALADRYDPAALPTRDLNVLLFGPGNANLRRDPRFMRLAARIGLAKYWRDGGRWPDFCAERTLPYNCKAEAAKALAATKT